MIDKVFPRKLNSSKDTRLHAQDEMLDAVNVTIADVVGEFSKSENKTPSGSFGVLKPLKGNSSVDKSGSFTLANGSKVIGSCNDERAGRIYYFIYSPTASQKGVYYYSVNDDSFSKLTSSALFNFRGNSFVEGNVVYVANSHKSDGEPDLKPILFFTDNHTEPKKIDILRAVTSPSSDLSFLDFVSVCPRTPIDPPIWTFLTDPNYKVSNFRGERGFQFAYQNIYKSGDISAISTYSTLAVPSAYINQGTVTNPNFFAENYISVQVPSEAFTTEVDRVRVLARSGNSGSWFIVDESQYEGGDFETRFYNDQIYNVLPEAETRKQFDSVPKKARTQDVTNNRLFYGNYVEGFDVPDVDASITHAFAERPQDFVGISLNLIPEVRQVNPSVGAEETLGNGLPATAEVTNNNRVSAYRLDSSDVPQTVSANTQVSFNITVSPDKNFHFYESRDSFHSSAILQRLTEDGEEFHVATDIEHQGLFPNFDGGEFKGIPADGTAFFNAPEPNGFEVPVVDGGTGGLKREGITTSPYGLTNDDAGIVSPFPRWEPEFTDAPFRATYGTSAQNPFILQGKSCNFSGSFVTLVDMDKPRLVSIIKDMLINRHESFSSSLFDQADNGAFVSVVNIESLQNRFQYSIDLNIQNKDKIGKYGTDDPLAKLVVAVGDYDSIVNSDTRQLPPCGYFIVNKAKPTVGFRDISPYYAYSSYNQAEDVFLALDLISIEDAEYMTCVPDVEMGKGLPSKIINSIDDDDGLVLESTDWGNVFDGFVCMTRQFIKSPDGLSAMSPVELGATNILGLFKHCGEEINAIINNGSFDITELTVNEEGAVLPAISFFSGEGDLDNLTVNLYGGVAESIAAGSSTKGYLESRNVVQMSRWLGCLLPTNGQGLFTFEGATPTYFVQGGDLVYTFERYCEDVELEEGVDLRQDVDAYMKYAFTMIDGERSVADSSFFNGDPADDDVPIDVFTTADSHDQNRRSLSHSNIVMGFASWVNQVGDVFVIQISIPFYQFNSNFGLLRVGSLDSGMRMWIDAVEGSLGDLDPPIISLDNPIIAKTHAAVEATVDVAISAPNVGGSSYTSFKTKATHDFGIVFYDQRGRSSDVAPLGSVYVGGYDSSENQGPVQVQVGLTSSPPAWAWHYQIVYGGNNTYEDFIQYTSGGAFVEINAEGDTGNIYVSLNYLQNNDLVSYTEAFGAVNEDGSKEMYTYKEGDKLRVISYYTDDSNREFPSEYEFDIIGTKLLADDEDNPLINQDNPPAIPSKVGQFLILRDNPNASGFTYTNVKNAQGNGVSPSSSNQHLWNNRCVVEIYRPLDSQQSEDRVYYEISKKYNVIRDASGSVAWENNNIVLNNGDVYFRKVAVNMPSFSSFNQKFLNIIKDSGSYVPKFRNYYLETSTFTDVIPNANQYNYGKPKIVNRFQKELRRDSSITFSDVTQLASPVLRYTSFDATTGNFKDLPNKHGQISRIVDYGDALFVLNEDKISAIPISRSVISDLSGQDFVVASEKVMGTQKFYAGENGCSTNPESVVRVGQSLYFANKERQEVYKFNPSNGVTIISDMGMKSYFRSLFTSVIQQALNDSQVRVVGGYDPHLDEYVLSVYNAVTIDFTSDTEVLQETGTVTPDAPIAPDPIVPEGFIEDLGFEDTISALENQIVGLEVTNQIILDQAGALYDAVQTAINGEGSPTLPELALQLQTFLANVSNEDAALAQQIQSAINELDNFAFIGSDISGLDIDSAVEVSLGELNQLISALDSSVTSSRNLIVENLVSISDSHALLLSSMETARDALETAGANVQEIYEEGDDIVIPSVVQSITVDGAAGGVTVTAAQYVQLLGTYRSYLNTEIDKYSDENGSFVFDDPITGSTTAPFTGYKIGFGAPTTESGSDEYPERNAPEDSALFINPNFISANTTIVTEAAALAAATGDTSIQFLIAEAEASSGADAAAVQALEEDKAALLDSINKILRATRDMYYVNPDGLVSYLFGPNGGDESGLGDFIVDTLLQGGDSTTEQILQENAATLENQMTLALFAGTGVITSDYGAALEEKNLVITSLQATRDVFAVRFFNYLYNFWLLAGSPDLETIDGLPQEYAEVLSISPTQSASVIGPAVIAALDQGGDGNLTSLELEGLPSVAGIFGPLISTVSSSDDSAFGLLRDVINQFLSSASDFALQKFGVDFTSPSEQGGIPLADWDAILPEADEIQLAQILDLFGTALFDESDDNPYVIAKGVENLQETIRLVIQEGYAGKGFPRRVFGQGWNNLTLEDQRDILLSGVTSPFDIGENAVDGGYKALVELHTALEIAATKLISFQRFLGNVDGQSNNQVVNPSALVALADYEGIGEIGVNSSFSVGDYSDFESLVADAGDPFPAFPSGFRNTGYSLLTGIQNALAAIVDEAEFQLDFQESLTGSTPADGSARWTFQNAAGDVTHVTTGTLADYIGEDLYNETVAQILADNGL